MPNQNANTHWQEKHTPFIKELLQSECRTYHIIHEILKDSQLTCSNS